MPTAEEVRAAAMRHYFRMRGVTDGSWLRLSFHNYYMMSKDNPVKISEKELERLGLPGFLNHRITKETAMLVIRLAPFQSCDLKC